MDEGGFVCLIPFLAAFFYHRYKDAPLISFSEGNFLGCSVFRTKDAYVVLTIHWSKEGRLMSDRREYRGAKPPKTSEAVHPRTCTRCGLQVPAIIGKHATALDCIDQLRSALAMAGWVAPRTQSEHPARKRPAATYI